MDWKDTVMDRAMIEAMVRGMPVHSTKENTAIRVAKAQAKLSFKAGIKEVVQFFDGKYKKDGGHIEIAFGIAEWQAKLKEWGLKEG